MKQTDQAICEELATAWGGFLVTGEPGWPAFELRPGGEHPALGGAVTSVTEPADDIVGYWIHGS
ncbi:MULTISPECIES: hypothetical protein [Streptomyces]|uniref:hypothetical protein n=1 Tax=Streptomyces TaxID=1883 RepID=UPI000E6A5F56|nr:MULTISPECIES: hypothetical protein [Streptomyces]MDX3064383.1 hypothetical protein [Streptomyces sp. ND04-05B]MDX3519643.1 hypothetical protein [Streptomyces scabiei]